MKPIDLNDPKATRLYLDTLERAHRIWFDGDETVAALTDEEVLEVAASVFLEVDGSTVPLKDEMH